MNGGRKEYHYGNVFTGKMLRFLPERKYSDQEITAFKNTLKKSKRGGIDTFIFKEKPSSSQADVQHRYGRDDCRARRRNV